jgi:hypothetical protein
MSVGLGEAMARPKKQGGSRRADMPVRIGIDVLERARIAAAFAGKTLSEYITDRLRPLVEQDIDEGYARSKPTGRKPKPER